MSHRPCNDRLAVDGEVVNLQISNQPADRRLATSYDGLEVRQIIMEDDGVYMQVHEIEITDNLTVTSSHTVTEALSNTTRFLVAHLFIELHESFSTYTSFQTDFVGTVGPHQEFLLVATGLVLSTAASPRMLAEVYEYTRAGKGSRIFRDTTENCCAEIRWTFIK